MGKEGGWIMLKKIAGSLVAVATLLAPITASAQSYQQVQLRDQYEPFLRDLSQRVWWYKYEYNSVGYPQVVEVSNDGQSIVTRAAYRYTNGQTDIISITVSYGQRTCLAYASENEYCSLTGKYSGQGGSSKVTAGDVVVGAVIIGAIAAALSGGGGSGSSSSSSSSSSDQDDFDRYAEGCRAQGKTPGNC